MDHNEMIAVIQAQKAGAQIEARRVFSNSKWFPIGVSEKFDFASYVYRAKPQPPKPREWWIKRPYGQEIYEVVEGGVGILPGYIRVREVL